MLFILLKDIHKSVSLSGIEDRLIKGHKEDILFFFRKAGSCLYRFR